MKIIRAVNLLGDTLYSLKPIATYRMRHIDDKMAIGVMPGFAGDMVKKQFGTLMQVADMNELDGEVMDLSAGLAAQMAVSHLLQTKQQLHISECYARILGVDSSEWGGSMAPLTGWAIARRSKDERHPYAIVAPFSRSCASHQGMRPNKTLEHNRWTLTLDWLRKEKKIDPIVLLGNEEKWSGSEDVALWYADSLEALISILTGAQFVITVDNGIGHVASALNCRTFILWPPVSSVGFIAPVWNKATTLMYMRPERVRADQLLTLMKKEISK